MDCSERPVTEAILTNLRGCAAEAAGMLGRRGGGGRHAGRAGGGGRRVRRPVAARRPARPGVAADDVPFLLGSLWGEAIVAALGWAWAQVVFNRHTDTVAAAVVSPDRSLAVFPIHLVLGAAWTGRASTARIARAFDRLAAGAVGGFTPGGYANVMDVATHG